MPQSRAATWSTALRREVRSWSAWKTKLTQDDGSLDVEGLTTFARTAASDLRLGHSAVRAFYRELWRGGKSAARITWPSLAPKGAKRAAGGRFKQIGVAERLEQSSARAMLAGGALRAAQGLLGYCKPRLTGEWVVRVRALGTN